ncbi:MAG: hypothetical protein LBM13_00655 [Candidatus Ancillula sp.]|jgi:DivIVA domain-containing protein|nr:hypothetical protein [Candidatus Ancillula sp.]
MATVFSRVTGKETGYETSGVDAFFNECRELWNNDFDQLSEQKVRFCFFEPQKGGYKIYEVDEALDRLERAIAKRRKEEEIAKVGEEVWAEELNQKLSSLYDNISKDKGSRFPRVTSQERGYKIREVDKFLDKLDSELFGGRRSFDVAMMKDKQFVVKKGPKAYDTYQVDLFLDKVITILNAIEE